MNEPETKGYKSIINRVDEGFRYFDGYRLEELKEDDNYYIKAFMLYIEDLEAQNKSLNAELLQILKSKSK